MRLAGGHVMRKRRAIIFDDEPVVLDVFKLFFELRGYEVLTFREPVTCVVYGDEADCPRPSPCADIIITDFRMPKMNGLDMLRAQAAHGCKLTNKNKALISGYIGDDQRGMVEELGAAFFSKPVDFDELIAWVESCEPRMDLSQPVAIKRREPRHACSLEVLFGTRRDHDILRGTTVNMSTAGACLRTKHHLEPLQEVIIQTNPPHPPQQAAVRWVKNSGSGSYLVGMNFLS